MCFLSVVSSQAGHGQVALPSCDLENKIMDKELHRIDDVRFATTATSSDQITSSEINKASSPHGVVPDAVRPGDAYHNSSWKAKIMGWARRRRCLTATMAQ
ncbi:hypothetical protein Pcinc_031748 [Petrolisthes cinctipes]|uniref:Uncharacterized protein n=1 Tax=Petrolisthes cinctipes TaxID=88211 RepID=A0AAE1EVH9_PETCI|nr:hypothetical protein Pcinc_031748 [Petrolisthes cinctipes]